MKTAAAYVRVSTEKQDEYSLDSQLKLIRAYAGQHDMIVPEEFVFVEDGVSGRSAKARKEFQRMIAHAKQKEPPFNCILVWKFSRFARNQEESILYKSMLARSGVEVISISETLDDSPFSSLIERIIEWMDEFYSIRLSGEVKRGMLEKVSRGEVVTHPPFGYSSDGKKYFPNEQAVYVRRIYKDFAEGKGMATIAREINELGIKTIRGKAFDNRQIKYILSNPAYIGKIRWSTDGKSDYRFGAENENAILIDGHYETLVDVDTWETVQKKLDRLYKKSLPYTRHDQPVEWMLKGLMRCSNCGATLVYTALASPSMQCYRYARGLCRVSHSLTIRKANAAVIAGLEKCVEFGNFPLAPVVLNTPAPGKDFAKLISAEELKLKRVHAAYEAGVDTLEEYASKKKKIQSSIAALEKEMSETNSHARQTLSIEDMRDKVSSVLKIVKSEGVSEEAKNAALRSVLSHVVYEKENKRLALYFLFE